jgi:hypothetical protein
MKIERMVAIEGRQEDEGIGLGKGQRGESIDAENAGDAAGQAAQRHQPGPAHADRITPALVARLQEQQHQGGEQGREEADLEHGQVPAQRLHVGIAAREQEVCGETKGNALDRRMRGGHAGMNIG